MEKKKTKTIKINTILANKNKNKFIVYLCSLCNEYINLMNIIIMYYLKKY